MKNLKDALEKAGQSAVVLDERILITPFGGRILGLFPDGTHNLLWVSDDLEKMAAEFFRQDGWKNIGGDRTWVAPELEINGDPNAFDQYDVPATMDPGAYRIVDKSDTSVTLQTEMAPVFRSPGQAHPLTVEKSVEILKKPADLDADIEFAGYTLTTILSTPEAVPAHIHPEAWNLLQVPGGGRMIIPTQMPAEPRTFIGKPELDVTEKSVTARVETDASYKFCIHADACSGRMMYIRELENGRSSLVLRTFPVHDATAYSDVPADDPAAIGYLQQFYVDDGALGGFGELEYHTPYLTSERPRIEDRSEVQGFVGPKAAMERMI